MHFGQMVRHVEQRLVLIVEVAGDDELAGSFEAERRYLDAAIVADGCASFFNGYVEVGGESQAYIGTASVDD